MGLKLENIRKTVGREVYLADINLSLEPGSRNVLLGRTLGGKTSLLRIMAGLDRPTRGRVFVDGQDVTGVSVRKRGIAMVYQQFINYPSLTVYQNVASPLRLAGYGRDEIDRRVRRTAEMLRIDTLLNRLPSELSGGQQQRTAIARALVKDAKLLLLDEPLVNLDYKLREELREELQEIFKAREAIVVYTTTEPAEALMIGGEVAVIHEGRILQTGSTADVYHRPTTPVVAEVFSDPPINFLRGTVEGSIGRIGENLRLPLPESAALAPGDYLFGVRASHLFLHPESDDDLRIPATVELSEINGSETFIHVRHGGDRLVIQEDGIHSRKMGGEITVFTHPDCFYIYNAAGHLAAAPELSSLRRRRQ